MNPPSNLYLLMAAWICSRVFPFVSGTTKTTKTIARPLIAAYRMKVPANHTLVSTYLKKTEESCFQLYNIILLVRLGKENVEF